MSGDFMSEIQRTPLYNQHVAMAARMAPFAGYDMPVNYPSGILSEHNWTRNHAGLFDVSHMGQGFIEGPDFESTALALERIVPADILGLAPLQQRYTQLLAEDGGILDDLMVTRMDSEGRFYVVVNAARKAHDFAYFQKHLPQGIALQRRDDLALLALQGPKAEEVLAALDTRARNIAFMHSANLAFSGMAAQVSRSGYSGEDGFEISVAAQDAARLWNLLLQNSEVKPIGLGARDSLRLEAGLCLYGHDMDEATSPVEADLLWSIGKRRRIEGGFIGSARVLAEIAKGVTRKRVGIKPDGRAPAREGTLIRDSSGMEIGRISSGGFGPTVNGPVAMGYVNSNYAQAGLPVQLIVRDKVLAGTIVKLPFVPNKFKR
jgi:aminomethyltransferase